MDYRKLISFGKGGYVISVPKDWVMENKLVKGSFISIERSNGSLVLVPKERKKQEISISEMIIDVDGKDEMTVRRELTAAYLNAYEIVQLRGEELKKFSEAIKNEGKNLIALDILESTKNKIVFKDFLNYEDLSVDKIFKKMDIFIRSMLIDLKPDKKDLWPNIIIRDEEINKHFNLVLKILKKCLIDPSVSKSLNLNTPVVFRYRDNIFTLEYLGDEIKRAIEYLNVSKPDKKTFNWFFEKLKEAEGFYLSTMKALYKNDIQGAYDLYEKNKEFIKGLQNFKGKSVEIRGAEIIRGMALLINVILRRIYMEPIANDN